MPLITRPLPVQLYAILDQYPVRWASSVIGDYDGRDRTLEIFNADVQEQITLLQRLRNLRPILNEIAGGPVVIIFHTRSETRRLYADVLDQKYQANNST